MRIFAAIALLTLAGCSAQPKSRQTASEPSPPATQEAKAVVASAPREILQLTDQKMIYDCPKCGMDFDAAGACSMDGAELVATRVDYSCPQDGQAVERAGQCPRCPMNARVRTTTMAGAVPSDHR